MYENDCSLLLKYCWPRNENFSKYPLIVFVVLAKIAIVSSTSAPSLASSTPSSPPSPFPLTINDHAHNVSISSSITLDAQLANKQRWSIQSVNSSSMQKSSTFGGKKAIFDSKLLSNPLYNNSSSSYQPFYQLSSRPNLFNMFINDTNCQSNCSGHGDCYNGTCFCEVDHFEENIPSEHSLIAPLGFTFCYSQVEYSGGTCNDPNFKYYISFSTVYYMICVVSFIQLVNSIQCIGGLC